MHVTWPAPDQAMVPLQCVWEGVTLTLTLTVLSVIITIISIFPPHGERWAGAGTLRHQLAASWPHSPGECGECSRNTILMKYLTITSSELNWCNSWSSVHVVSKIVVSAKAKKHLESISAFWKCLGNRQEKLVRAGAGERCRGWSLKLDSAEKIKRSKVWHQSSDLVCPPLDVDTNE